MNENYLTLDIFSKAMERIDQKFDAMDQRFDASDLRFASAMEKIDRQFVNSEESLKKFMMEGFSMLDGKIDYLEESLSSRIDDLLVTKADREEVYSIHKRVVKLEKKIA